MAKKAIMQTPLGPLTELGQFKKDIIPGFNIIEQVGKGASSVVFSATDKKTGERVALKVFYLHYCKNREFVHRLIREADIVKRIRHPNVVAGYGYGTYEGYYYMVMEFADGDTLTQLLKTKLRLEEKEAAKIILQVARGLEAAEKQKTIHRDIKPSNIIITSAPEGIIARLTDFGLAREQVDTSLTMPGLILGTPLYVSPEQARGETNLDIRTDIYALGITFYQLIVGKPPFADLNTSLLLTKKITDDIPYPMHAAPGVSEETSAIIMKMCQREPARRYQNCASLIQDLELYLDGRFEPDATRIIQLSVEAPLSQEEIKSITDAEIKSGTLDPQVLTFSNPKILRPSEILFYEEDTSREAYLLLKGALEILKAGRRVALIDTPGSFVGEMSTLLKTGRTATVRAVERTILLEISEGKFQEFLHCTPEIALNLARDLASRLQSTTDKLKKAQGRLSTIIEHYRLIRDDLEKPLDE
ncbi:MAG: protein kinase [Candidatus Sumerlaeota bacterium]|nr:protein kinase [Candidatus Sumerlaeota bacterium]